MKKLLIKILPLIVLIATISSCKKETTYTAQPSGVTPQQTFLKINFVSTYAANPSVQLEVNKTRVSGLITARTPFPGGGYNTGGGNYPDYLAIDPGSVQVTAAIPKKGTNVDSVVLANTTVTLAADKHYTLHITDTAANTKYLLLEDNVTITPDDGTSLYRFVNLIPNTTAVDLYYGSTLVVSGIQYLTASNYFVMPITGTAQTWTIRETGTPATGPALAIYTILNKRVYTVFGLGYKGATDATRKPYVSFFLNK